MKYSYDVHPLVQYDYDEAYAWYEDRQKGLGERFVKAVRQKIEDISSNPHAHGSKGKKNLREAKVDFFPYLIIYRIDNRIRKIYITSIHHTKKHPRKKYRKE